MRPYDEKVETDPILAEVYNAYTILRLSNTRNSGKTKQDQIDEFETATRKFTEEWQLTKLESLAKLDSWETSRQTKAAWIDCKTQRRSASGSRGGGTGTASSGAIQDAAHA
ncbi:hypothetical protein P7C73_g36, partial [Tremellales sp. Uapishka_1]